MIYGIGTDLVDISRLDRIRNRWKEKFTKKIYSEGEILYCETKANPSIHYAARFAVKEAFIKCIGFGIWSGLKLKDIEVVNDQEGRPMLKVKNKIEEMIRDEGVTDVHVSISHTEMYATAVVVLEKVMESK